MFPPELYDLVYSSDRERSSEYYRVNRVFSLGEYAILSLGNHYKYGILPHFIVRGGQGESRWHILNILRELRVALFFDTGNFHSLYDELCEAFSVVQTFIFEN